MNFLAHALLSPDDDAIRAGNVAADFIKGGIDGIAHPGIAAGVALHRAIDRFADRHPVFRACADYVAPPRTRYARVIVDVFFDHCLARCWTRYSAVRFEAFVENVCTELERRADVIPVRDRARFTRMVESRWLGIYATRAGIDRVFAGLARRARFARQLDEAALDLDRHYPAIEASFHVLMPALRVHANSTLTQVAGSRSHRAPDRSRETSVDVARWTRPRDTAAEAVRPADPHAGCRSGIRGRRRGS